MLLCQFLLPGNKVVTPDLAHPGRVHSLLEFGPLNFFCLHNSQIALRKIRYSQLIHCFLAVAVEMVVFCDLSHPKWKWSSEHVMEVELLSVYRPNQARCSRFNGQNLDILLCVSLQLANQPWLGVKSHYIMTVIASGVDLGHSRPSSY